MQSISQLDVSVELREARIIHHMRRQLQQSPDGVLTTADVTGRQPGALKCTHLQ